MSDAELIDDAKAIGKAGGELMMLLVEMQKKIADLSNRVDALERKTEYNPLNQRY